MTATVTLGLVNLETFEIPQTITYGGRQRLAVHDLPGGGRVIDVLGGADTDITFSGIISGSGAERRAQLLNALRISGATVPLSWGEQYYLIIIAAADFDYRKSWWIPYRLRCVVQSNLTYAAFATAASAALGIATNLASAASALGSVPGPLSAAQTALAQPGATTYGTAAYGQSISALGTAQTAVSGDVARTGGELPSLDLGFTAQDPTAAASAMTSATGTAGSLAALALARGYIGSGFSALQNIGT
ncbi:MAG: hypothetical protein HIU92_17730 [Proteobacteria bacterium]|nr:hypothetical protein [Pseudomonadota bacterium]